MAFPFIDNFDRPDGPPGSDWQVLSGTWAISSGRLIQTDLGIASTAPFIILVAEPAPSANQYAQARVWKDATNGKTTTFILRYSDNAGVVTFYRAGVRSVTAGTDTWAIERYTGNATNGTFTAIVSGLTQEVADGTLIRASADGTTIKLQAWEGDQWVDKLVGTDGNVTASGQLGVRLNNNGGSGFDDFEAGSLDAPPVQVSISGTITDGSNPLADVTVSVTGGTTTSVTTNASGQYSVTGLTANLQYTLTPALEGYTFSPVNRQLTPATDATGQDFTGTLIPEGWDVSGTVTLSGSGLQGVTINATGTSSTSAVTGAGGTFSIQGLTDGGNYTITPSLAGYTFDPVNRTFNPLTADQTGADFAATSVVPPTPPDGGYWRDAFTRADGAVGSDWLAAGGSWSIGGNQLTQTGTGVGVLLWNRDPDNRNYGPDCYAQAKFYPSGVNGVNQGVVIKYANTDQVRYYYGGVRTISPGTDVWEIVYREGGTDTVLGTLTEDYVEGTAVRLSYTSSNGQLRLEAYTDSGWVTKLTGTNTSLRDVSGTSGVRANALTVFDSFEAGVTPGQVNLVCSWLGAATHTTQKVGFRTSEAASVTVEYSTDSGMAGAQSSSAYNTTSGEDFTGHVTLTGLTPNTVYYYRTLVNGVTKMYSPFPSFRTFVTPGTSGQFNFVFGSCQSVADGLNNDVIWDAVLAKQPRFLMNLGDNWYSDKPVTLSNTLGNYRSRARLQFTKGTMNSRFTNAQRNVPTFTTWDDHELINDFSGGKADSRYNNARQTFQEYSHRTNPDPITAGEIYYTFQYGEVGVFVFDGRSFRSANSATDNATKTYLGAVQKQALKDWLVANKDTFKVKVIASDTAWHEYIKVGVANDSLGDGFTTERNEIWDFVKNNGITGCIYLSADQHWSHIVKTPYNGMTFHECGASAFNTSMATPPTSMNGQPDVIWKSPSQDRSFGMVTIDTSVEPAAVTYQVFNPAGTQYSGAVLNFTTADTNAGLLIPIVVSAGPDRSVTLPASATLNGSASGPDGITFAWSEVSGPGDVTFGSANAAVTTASFSEAGTYVLRLTASATGQVTQTDDVTVTVHPQGVAAAVNGAGTAPGFAPHLPASLMTEIIQTPLEDLTVSHFNHLLDALARVSRGNDPTAVVGTLLRVTGSSSPTVVGAAEVTWGVAGHLTAEVLTGLLATPVELLTVAQVQMIADALSRVPKGAQLDGEVDAFTE